jgi:hypothetical protein
MFHQYAQPFFICEECPHIRRVLEETGILLQYEGSSNCSLYAISEAV